MFLAKRPCGRYQSGDKRRNNGWTYRGVKKITFLPMCVLSAASYIANAAA